MGKNILIIAGVGVLGAGIYFYYKSRKGKLSNDASTLSSFVPSSSQQSNQNSQGTSTTTVPSDSNSLGSSVATGSGQSIIAEPINSQTNIPIIPTTTTSSTTTQIAVNQAQAEEALRLLQAQAIQAQALVSIGASCGVKPSMFSAGYATYNNCYSVSKIATYMLINQKINPLGFKLSQVNNPSSAIVKLTV